MSKTENNKIPVEISEGRRVTITKISDDVFKQQGKNHPNLIDEGFTKSGIELFKPTVGERYYVSHNFATSIVLEIIDETTFKTTYSTYKIEYWGN